MEKEINDDTNFNYIPLINVFVGFDAKNNVMNVVAQPHAKDDESLIPHELMQYMCKNISFSVGKCLEKYTNNITTAITQEIKKE